MLVPTENTTMLNFTQEIAWWRRRPKTIKAAVAVMLVTMALLVAVVVYAWGRYQEVVVTARPTDNLSEEASPTPDPNRPLSILLMGYGGGGHQGGKLTDTMMVVYIQPALRTIHLLSIPRDVWVSLPIIEGQAEQPYKINAAYALGSDDKNYRRKPAQFTGPAGGGELAKYAVHQALGIEVDHFAVLNFASFKKAIDVLGGIDVRVETTFDDYEYPIDGQEQDTCGKTEEEVAAVTATLSADLAPREFPCRYEHLHFDRGVQHMDGETALKFVRSRHSAQDGNDFGRAARQRNLLIAVKDKVLSINFIPKIIPFISSLSTDFQTDIGFGQMQKLLDAQSEYSSYEIISVPITEKGGVFTPGRSSNGQYVLLPVNGEGQWQVVHDWVRQSLASGSASISGQPTEQ